LSGHWIPLGFSQAPWIWVLMAMFAGGPLCALHGVDSLPISRRRLFHLIALPGLLVALICFVGARIVGDAQRDRRPLIECRMIERESGGTWCRLSVPDPFYEIAWTGRPPELRAPWGESHAPWSGHLVRGLAPAVYSPYDTPADASVDFVAWQMSRAIEAVYGATIPPEELRARYLIGREDASAGSAFTLLDDYPSLDAAARTQILPFGAVWIALPGLLLLALALPRLAHSAAATRRYRTFRLLLLIPIFLAGGYIGAALGELIEPDFFVSAGELLARRIAAATPGGTATLWVLALLLTGCGYRIAERRFRKIEVPIAR
jgi:hypothetical protein